MRRKMLATPVQSCVKEEQQKKVTTDERNHSLVYGFNRKYKIYLI